ncbi:MAG: enoyl-CoA hydratase/isomerase family protein [Gemmatimonadetes bacterium]|nr:enoyl-CoA hydratase/isomerase family protein [Gemmatimonadota bacterium]
MNQFFGETLSWETEDRIATVTLHNEPANEIGSRTLEELEILQDSLPLLEREARVLILQSSITAGFSAGADLRELHRRMQGLDSDERERRVRDFLVRTHRVLDALDQTALTTIAALHGVVFGGGLELALTCDILIADRFARFCFPELRLGLIPGFGGTPRLRRDLGNAIVRDLLLLGRSLGADRAYQVGLVSQLAGEGRAPEVARACAKQAVRFDPISAEAAKDFIKRLPREELDREIDLFCNLFARPAVEEALRRFVESTDPMPWLPNGRETQT